MGLITDIVVGAALEQGLLALGNKVDQACNKAKNAISTAEHNQFEKDYPNKFAEYLQIADQSKYEHCFFTTRWFEEKKIINAQKETMYSLKLSRINSLDLSAELVFLDSNNKTKGYVKDKPAKKSKGPLSSHYTKMVQEYIVEKNGKSICNICLHKNSDPSHTKIVLKSQRWNGTANLQDCSWNTNGFKACSFFGNNRFGYIEHNEFKEDFLEELYLVYLATVYAREINWKMDLKKNILV